MTIVYLLVDKQRNKIGRLSRVRDALVYIFFLAWIICEANSSFKPAITLAKPPSYRGKEESYISW